MAHFNFNNGRLRVCQFTDIHLDTTENPEGYAKTFALMERAIDETAPDLVTITGDLAWGQGTQRGVEELVAFFEKKGVFWAPVLGNHDGNPSDSEIKTREAFASILIGPEHCLFETGEAEVDGNGNYTVTVGGSQESPAWVLFMLDSHQGDIYPSQLAWYARTSAALPKGHGELAFFHIPLPEYLEVWDYSPCLGYKLESICATRFNDGLFAAMARSGAMRGIFVGHDHINDFEGTLCSIRLCYGRGSGYQAYGADGYRFGARIIDLTADTSDFSTKIFLDDGSLYAQTTPHRPKLCGK